MHTSVSCTRWKVGSHFVVTKIERCEFGHFQAVFLAQNPGLLTGHDYLHPPPVRAFEANPSCTTITSWTCWNQDWLMVLISLETCELGHVVFILSIGYLLIVRIVRWPNWESEMVTSSSGTIIGIKILEPEMRWGGRIGSGFRSLENTSSSILEASFILQKYHKL